jgi:hypothetical protein
MSDPRVQIGIELLRCILPVIITVGVVGNSLNIVVLTRPRLYYHACSQYFLALASNNLVYTGIILIEQLLASGYQMNLSNYSMAACKAVNYISTTTSFLAPYFIVCASMDRYCTSSTNALIRRFSSVRMALRMILIVIIVFLLIFINILVLADLQPAAGFTCVVEANTLYSQIYIITQVFLFAVVPPILMIFFGLMTIRNLHQTNVVAVVVSRFNRTERQLARMLFVQVTVNILLTLPTSITYLMSALPNTIRNTSTFSFASTICQLFFNFSYATSFFLYLLSGRIYRKELFRLVYKVFRIRGGRQIEPLEDQNTVLQAVATIYP